MRPARDERRDIETEIAGGLGWVSSSPESPVDVHGESSNPFDPKKQLVDYVAFELTLKGYSLRGGDFSSSLMELPIEGKESYFMLRDQFYLADKYGVEHHELKTEGMLARLVQEGYAKLGRIGKATFVRLLPRSQHEEVVKVDLDLLAEYGQEIPMSALPEETYKKVDNILGQTNYRDIETTTGGDHISEAFLSRTDRTE